MKNKNNVLHQLDKIDSITNQLNFVVKNQQPIEEYLKLLEILRETVDQTRLFVESEQTMYNY
jgi:hypothetical protein